VAVGSLSTLCYHHSTVVTLTKVGRQDRMSDMLSFVTAQIRNITLRGFLMEKFPYNDRISVECRIVRGSGRKADPAQIFESHGSRDGGTWSKQEILDAIRHLGRFGW
jgi:hypothetical protein